MKKKDIIKITGLKSHDILYYSKLFIGKINYQYEYSFEDLKKIAFIAFLKDRGVPVQQIKMLLEMKEMKKCFVILRALKNSNVI